MPSDWRPDWYITVSAPETAQEAGEKLWEELTHARQKLLERHSKSTYRDTNGKLWFKDVEWYNLHSKQRQAIRPRGVPEGTEHISAMELLGALVEEEVKLIRFYRRRVKVTEPQYAMRQVGRRYNYGNGGEDGSTRRSGGYTIVYRRVLVERARYEYRTFVRELDFRVLLLRKKLDEIDTEN